MGRCACVVLVVLAGCLGDALVPCGDALCPSGSVCTPGGCATSDEVAACAGKADGDTCSTAAIVQGHCAGGACHESKCGNGIIEFGEVCDDGNTDSGDGCSARCDSDETCGNGVVDVLVGEQCDSGIHGLSGDGCSSTCTVELALWHDATPIPLQARSGAATTFDSHRSRVVMFGGSGEFDTLGDTWEYDGAAWTQRFPETSPSPRYQAMITYDEQRHVSVMFGGVGFDGAYLADTWEWNGDTWTERTPATSPTSRSGGVMAYDRVHKRAILFGGLREIPFADTWAWDGTTWTELQPSSTPLARVDAVAIAFGTSIVMVGGEATPDAWQWTGDDWVAMSTAPDMLYEGSIAYDAGRDAVVLFGGYDASGPTADIWEYSGAAWTKVGTATSPTPRSRGQLATDPAGGVVLFGGNDGGSAGVYADTWNWDGSIWRRRSNASAGPAPREAAVLGADPLSGTLVMFGGTNYLSAFFADTWQWDGAQWRAVPPGGPSGRASASMVYDRARRTLVMFGGYGHDSEGFLTIFDDTWTFDSAWHVQMPATVPPSRVLPGLANDEARERIVMFGGRDDDTATWLWDGSTWTDAHAAVTPSARAETAMAYDVAHQRVVLFGGYDQIHSVYLADTWTWDGTTWTQQTPATSPTPRTAHKLVYDERTQRVLLYGGIDPIGTVSTETWAWDGTNWTRLALAAAPTRRAQPAVAYDPVHAQVVLFGGDRGSAVGVDTAVWIYQFASAATPADRCVAVDTDGDGLAGCADPDCAPRCTPLCRPGETCDPADPRCGDGTCSPLEDWKLCPVDCPAPM